MTAWIEEPIFGQSSGKTITIFAKRGLIAFAGFNDAYLQPEGPRELAAVN